MSGFIFSMDEKYKQVSGKSGWTSVDIEFKFLHDHVQQAAYALIEEEYKKEVWVSFTCNKDLEFRDGSSIIKACEILSSLENVSTIGVNCFSPLLAERAIKKLKEHSNKKILIYPNSGEIYNNKDKDWYGEKYFDSSMIKKWLALSPDIIGGCCRVGFEDIKNMREEINFL